MNSHEGLELGLSLVRPNFEHKYSDCLIAYEEKTVIRRDMH